jgi:Apea-like HEPN
MPSHSVNLALSYSRFLLYTHDLGFYPQAEIDQVLDAIRVATGTPTGYAQVFMRPVGWAWDYRAHLPPVITGAIIRKYPADFDNGAWTRTDLPTISAEEIAVAGEIYRGLSNAPGRLTLAAERLGAAMLREHEADTILDLCIGLEAVLGDESPGDITYKLALRAAAVLSASGISDDPKTIFNHIKAIYRYRSAVAHGRPSESRRVLRDAEGSELLAVDVAREYLRSAIIALSARPELAAKPEELDAGLILESLASLRPDEEAQPSQLGHSFRE